jgi:hypothetical protein
LRSGALVGCELVLHLHDGDELLHVDAFHHHVVRAGLTERVDQWLLRRVIEIAADDSLPLAGVPLGIGVTGGVLEDRSLTARLQNDLTQAAVDPRRIVLQIRETAGVDLVRARASAAGLRRLGVGIALDGFGGLAPADAFAPNAAGLYNMLGNVWEWTSTYLAKSSRQRVLRGGSYLDSASGEWNHKVSTSTRKDRLWYTKTSPRKPRSCRDIKNLLFSIRSFERPRLSLRTFKSATKPASLMSLLSRLRLWRLVLDTSILATSMHP